MESKKNIYVILLSLMLLAAGGGWRAEAQQFALGTDALMLGALTPNLSAELVTGEKTSLNLTAAGSFKPYGLDFKGYGLRPEFKLWLSGRPMVRDYLGVMGFFSGYDMCFSGKVRQGKACGLGLSFGYAIPLGDRFNLELSLGGGVMYYSQRLYLEGENYSDYFPGGERVRDNSRGYSLVPMKLSAVFVWIIK